jgi:LacI family transcriptional regulator
MSSWCQNAQNVHKSGWQCGGGNVTERAKLSDVARLAGVSQATASRVLNANGRVAPELAERVLKARETLGYRQNSLARGLRTRANNVVGVVIPDVTNPFFTDLVRGIEDVVRESDYLLVLCNTDETSSKENDYLRMLADQNIAGLVIAPVQSNAGGPMSALAGIPAVSVDRRVAGDVIDSVTLDNVEGAHALTRHLIGNTRRAVATVTGPLVTTTASERLTGYRRALADAGIDFEPAYVVESDYSSQGGYLAAQKLLALPRPPAAIFCGNNAMTQGVLRAISERAEGDAEISLASFDPLPWAADPSHQIVSLDVPSYEMGRTAAHLLLERIRGDITGAARRIEMSAGAVR